jgi:hypothetical protein
LFNLVYDIFTAPYINLLVLFQAFENVLWLWYAVFAWWVRVRLIVLEFLYQQFEEWIVALWDIIVWFWTNIFDWIVDFFIFIIEVIFDILKLFNDWYLWADYSLYHYEEYLISEYFNNYVWVDIIGFLEVIFVLGIYFFFWPITIPITFIVIIIALNIDWGGL